MDLDHFKRLNDRAGHAIGDAALRAAATVLRYCTRDCDSVGRMGGDEFCVLLAGVDPLAAENVAGRMLDRLRHTFIEAHGSQIGIEASIGLARVRAGEDAETLLRRVDGACYASKRTGRNRLTIESSDLFPAGGWAYPLKAKSPRPADAAVIPLPTGQERDPDAPAMRRTQVGG
jgi:diguanylate cyclase (GGDEF)-like protein